MSWTKELQRLTSQNWRFAFFAPVDMCFSFFSAHDVDGAGAIGRLAETSQ